MTIYTPSGAALYEAPITTSAIIKRLLMGDYYIELSFDAVERIDISRGCYILYEGRKFEIMNNVLPEDTDKGGLRYTLRFEAQQSHMKRCKVFWLDSDNREVTFSDTTSISVFGDLIIRNVNKFLKTDNWSLGSVPSELNSTFKAVAFNGDFCWDAVNNIAETFGVEWWTDEDGDKVSLCFGKLEIGNEVEFRKGGIVSSIPSKKGDSADYGTRFYVFGSTKNLPEDYASSEAGGITNHVVEKRLHLPDGITYIDAREDLTPEDIVEQVVFFDDIFPVNTDEVSAVYTSYEEVIEGQQDPVYTIYSENTPFTPENSIEGEQVQCKFTSGSLTGQTFDVEFNTTSFDKRFKIVPNILDEEGGVIIPNKDLYPKAGDTFILTGIQLPQERITEAEHLLLDAGKEYAKKNSNDTDVYECPTNAVHCHKNNCNYDLGQRVILVGEKFGDGRSSRIQGYVKKLYDEYQATYTVGDNSAYSRLASVEKAVKKSSYSDRVGLEANIIRSKSDSTIPSDYNVYSALAVEEYFLNKRRGGIVKGFTSFQNGIAIGNIKIECDKDRLALRIGGNLYTIGGITAGGVGSGGSGGGGGISYNRLDSWADYSADKAGYVLSALLGKDLDNRVSALANAGYVTASALAPYILRSEVEGQYLSTYGGTMVKGAGIFNGADPNTGYGAIGFNSDHNAFGSPFFPTKLRSSRDVTLMKSSGEFTLLHTGNYSTLLAGGTVNGSLTATSFIGGTSTISGDLKGLQNLIFADGYLGRKFSLTNGGSIFYQAPSVSGGWATNWSVKSNDGITSFGDLAGAFGVGNSFSYFYYGGEYDSPSIAIMPSGMIAIGGTTADEKLHVHGNGKFTGALTVSSLTIGGVTLTYDSVNNALCINGNMYALGGITAGAAGISAYTSLELRVARLEQQLNIS